MSDPLQRGSVVLRGRAYGVVWDVRGPELVLLPIGRPREVRASDVAMELAELIGAGVAMPAGTVRVGEPAQVPADCQVCVGRLSGRVMCRVTLAAIHAAVEAAAAEKWDDERRHRTLARAERPVRLVG